MWQYATSFYIQIMYTVILERNVLMYIYIYPAKYPLCWLFIINIHLSPVYNQHVYTGLFICAHVIEISPNTFINCMVFILKVKKKYFDIIKLWNIIIKLFNGVLLFTYPEYVYSLWSTALWNFLAASLSFLI